MTKLKLTILVLLTISSTLLCATPSDIFLLRHSEKQSGKDPALSPQGQQRAQHLATLLAPFKPTLLLSSDYLRTQQTIAPLASTLNLAVKSYNPSKLRDVATWLKQQAGVVVIVGHSNTTPQLTELLAGQKVAVMSEQQYDIIYHIKYAGDRVILDRLSSNKL